MKSNKRERCIQQISGTNMLRKMNAVERFLYSTEGCSESLRLVNGYVRALLLCCRGKYFECVGSYSVKSLSPCV